MFGPRKTKKLIVACGRTLSELLDSLSPVASSSDCHFLRCGCRDSRHVCASESSSRLPCVLAAALLCLIHPFRSFHCRPSLQSSFIPPLTDSNLDPLDVSFQPKNGRSSRSCRRSMKNRYLNAALFTLHGTHEDQASWVFRGVLGPFVGGAQRSLSSMVVLCCAK